MQLQVAKAQCPFNCMVSNQFQTNKVSKWCNVALLYVQGTHPPASQLGQLMYETSESDEAAKDGHCRAVVHYSGAASPQTGPRSATDMWLPSLICVCSVIGTLPTTPFQHLPPRECRSQPMLLELLAYCVGLICRAAWASATRSSYLANCPLIPGPVSVTLFAFNHQTIV